MSIFHGSPLVPELSDEEFKAIGALVRQSSGINLHAGKEELVKARLGKRLRALGMSSYEQYLDYLRQDRSRDEIVSMLDAISTNVTSFFREPNHFEFLTQAFLPQFRARRGPLHRRLSLWSAGCSTGEEPYTIAMALCESVPDLATWDIRILATDLSTRALARAKEGVYEEDKVRGLPAGLRQKYFTPYEEQDRRVFKIDPAPRRLVYLARLNLLEAWPMHGPFDVIFCRNVMIYFERETRQELISRFQDILAPGGVLFIGHAESFTGLAHQLKFVGPTVYQKS